jgi:hypothetical protein
MRRDSPAPHTPMDMGLAQFSLALLGFFILFTTSAGYSLFSLLLAFLVRQRRILIDLVHRCSWLLEVCAPLPHSPSQVALLWRFSI